MSAGDWCLIESDPGVFTELISGIGVQGLQMEELYSLDEETLQSIKPSFGLIFLFKWQSGMKKAQNIVQNPDLFFANQVIHNACATQAILSVLLNCPDDIDIGEELREFKAFAMNLPNEMRGLAISNSDRIRTIHNSFARQESFSQESKRKAGDDDDVFHFVAYLPFQNRLYELDGLQPGPIDHGACDMEDWLAVAAPVIAQRIEMYSQGEIRFNLMAIIKDRRIIQQDRKNEIMAQLLSLPEVDPSDASATAISTTQLKQSLERESAECDAAIQAEDEKRKSYKTENVRRKHNYIPFIMELLNILAEKGELPGLLEAAKTKAAEHATATTTAGKEQVKRTKTSTA